MKYLDDVKVINDNYKELGIKKGYIGTIIDPDIRWDSFYVVFKTKEFMIQTLWANKITYLS